MKRLIKSLFWISIILSSCDYFNYAKAVHDDSERILASHKKFFTSLSFNGDISKKIYNGRGQLNKYQLIINLKEKEPKEIELSNLSYQPYYFFYDNNQLIISVTKDLYESIKEGSLIEKKMDSDSLICGRQQYNLLSDKKSRWLPD